MKTILAALLSLTSAPAIAGDVCDAQLPSALRAQVVETFAKFRTPAVRDNLPEDVEWNHQHQGNGCLGVAKADFDGDGRQDFLLGLTAKQGNGAIVLAALSRGGKWQFHRLAVWPEGRSRLYVSAENPGVYVRTEALDGPLQHGEVSPLKCFHPVAVFGTTESTGVAYCYKKGKWPHVWISD